MPQNGSNSGFDFTQHARLLCTDICRRLPAMCHIDMNRVAVGFAQARKRVSHGLHATLTPMRFEGGAATQLRDGKLHAAQKVVNSQGDEMLYILRFYLPRFMDVDFQEKLVTVFHELWHISPQFDGDLRRHPGRCYAHTESQSQYDQKMAELAKQWLALAPPEEITSFLELDFNTLLRRYGKIYGAKIQQPKLFVIG